MTHDSEERSLKEDLAAGRITAADFRRIVRELEQDARDYCRDEDTDYHRGAMSSDEEEQRVRY